MFKISRRGSAQEAEERTEAGLEVSICGVRE